MRRIGRARRAAGLVALLVGGCADVPAPPAARLALGPPTPVVPLTLGPDAPAPEAATLAVRLAPPPRALMALPAAWDVAVIRLSHPTVLSPARERTLAKGADLAPDGAGGYVATADMGGPLRAVAGYTLDVELWQGAPATGTLVAAKAQALALVAGPNAVTVALDLLVPGLSLAGMAPAAASWDAPVTLAGTGFDPATAAATLAGQPATRDGATATALDVRVPVVAPGTHTWQVTSAGHAVRRVGFVATPVEGAPVAVAAAASHQTDPAVAAGATGFLAAWVDDRLVVKDDVVARAVAPDGSLPTAEAFVTEATSTTELRPAMAYDAGRDRHLVAWQDGPGNSDIKARLLGPDGQPQAAAFAVAAGPGTQREPRVAFDGAADAYMVVWHDQTGIGAQRVAGAGAVLGAPVAVAPGAGSLVAPDVATLPAAGRHLVVWCDKTGASPVVRGRLLDAAGAPVGAAFVVAADAGVGQQDPGVAADGAGGFLVAWVAQTGATEVRARRVAADGTLGAASAIATAAGAKAYPRPAWAPWLGRFLVAWQQGDGDRDAWGAYLAPDGTPWGAPFVVAGGAAADQLRPEPAANAAAGRHLVVYEERAGADRRVMAQRVR